MTRITQPPEFNLSARTKVVVEASEWANREVLVKHLHEAGYEVVGCEGPEGSNARCALVATGECETVRQADVVVQSFQQADPRNAEVLAHLREHYPDTPIVVEVPTPRVDQQPELYTGCETVPYPATLAQLAAAVKRATTSAD